jgi:hypothetical protein
VARRRDGQQLERRRHRQCPAFTPRYRLESAPLWIATTADLVAAKAACSTSFTGAAAQMVQFVDGGGLDANYVCRRA